MQFQDDLAGGVVLIRPALQSPDYVTGVSGWAVKIDGSAEFTDVIIRGGTSIGGHAFYYSGTPALGNLVLSIADAAGVDAFGNSYDDGLTVYGSTGKIHTSVTGVVTEWVSDSGAAMRVAVGGGSVSLGLTPADVADVVWETGSLSASVGTRLGVGTPVTSLSSPYNSSSPSVSSISLYGSPKTPDGLGVTNEIRLTTQRAVVTGDLEAANFPAGAWQTWLPGWSTTTGAATPSYGNATFDCRYTQHGKTVTAHVDIVFGNTTNFGAGPTTADDWQFTLPVPAASAMQAVGFLEINAGIAARAVCRARAVSSTRFVLEFSTGLTDGSNPPNKFLIDALTPFTWTNADTIRGLLVYEAA